VKTSETSIPPELGTAPGYLEAAIKEAQPPFRFTRLQGGNSNLTYLIEDTRRQRWVLRRPPAGVIAATAHDVLRESRIMSALAGTVPVPRPVLSVDSPDLMGTSFFVMSYVPGVSLHTSADAENLLTAEARPAAAASLVDTLAQLHNVDPGRVGLGDLGRPDSYVERQLRRWLRQVKEIEIRELPILDKVHSQLTQHVPAQQGSSIVHGDYKFDNVILSPAGTVNAIVDWELCTLGDPLCDLAQLLMLWTEAGETDALGRVTASSAPGMLTRQQMVDRYAAASTRDLGSLTYYLALANWRIACVTETVYARLRRGALGERPQEEIDTYGDAVLFHAEQAARLVSGSA
jgi:aminoglycoside phosphotransferase (APT) family kinase protein